jgi:hypothetical protein
MQSQHDKDSVRLQAEPKGVERHMVSASSSVEEIMGEYIEHAAGTWDEEEKRRNDLFTNLIAKIGDDAEAGRKVAASYSRRVKKWGDQFPDPPDEKPRPTGKRPEPIPLGPDERAAGLEKVQDNYLDSIAAGIAPEDPNLVTILRAQVTERSRQASNPGLTAYVDLFVQNAVEQVGGGGAKSSTEKPENKPPVTKPDPGEPEPIEADDPRSDPEIQAEIAKALQYPGVKKHRNRIVELLMSKGYYEDQEDAEKVADQLIKEASRRRPARGSSTGANPFPAMMRGLRNLGSKLKWPLVGLVIGFLVGGFTGFVWDTEDDVTCPPGQTGDIRTGCTLEVNEVDWTGMTLRWALLGGVVGFIALFATQTVLDLTNKPKEETQDGH